jgi:hypothetical protein
MSIFDKLIVAQLQFPAFHGARMVYYPLRLQMKEAATRYGEQLRAAKNG